VFAGVVFFTMRQRVATPPDVPVATPDLPNLKVANQGPVEYELTENGKLKFRIVGKEHFVYHDGRNTIKNVALTLPDRNGKTIVINADEAEVTQPLGKKLGTAVFRNNVRLTSNDGLEVRTAAATYDDVNGVVNVPGPVEFTRGRLTGQGVGATYDRNRDLLQLLDRASLTVAPDATGKGRAHATAKTAGLARNDNQVKLVGDARVVSDDRTISADQLTAYFKPDGETIERVELRSNSRITETAANARNMAARDIDLGYAPDGQTLQHARLLENAVLDFPAAADRAARRIAARTIDLAMGPDGATVTSLNANEHVVVNLPAQGDVPAREIRSSTLQASGPASEGLRSATFAGGAEFRETKPGRGNQPALDRTAKAARLIVGTKPGFGDIEQADFRGNFTFSDGKTAAGAPRGVYVMHADRMDLSPSDGDPGPTPFVSDPQLHVEARNIQIAPATRKLNADTKVRSTIQPKSRTENGQRGRGSRGISPVSPPGEQQSKMPVMFKQDRPVYVAANRLAYDGTAEATYSGNARLWQDQSQSKIDADTIVLNDRTGNMTARGNVTTTMLLEEVNPDTKQTQLSQTVATSDVLVYTDDKRLAVYTGSKTVQANMKGPYGDVTANRIDLYLKEDGNELERAEAHGTVTVKETLRTATGDVLIYTAADDTYKMTGNPVEAIERETPTTCKKTLGTVLTFKRSVGSIRADTDGIVPLQVTQVPCPAERRN
jgi:LPS export ABC transporter protein LptC